MFSRALKPCLPQGAFIRGITVNYVRYNYVIIVNLRENFCGELGSSCAYQVFYHSLNTVLNLCVAFCKTCY